MTDKKPLTVKKSFPSWVIFVGAFAAVALVFIVGNLIYLRQYWKDFDIHTQIDAGPDPAEGSFCSEFSAGEMRGFIGVSGSGVIVVDREGGKLFADTGQKNIRCLPLVSERLVPGSVFVVVPERGGAVKIFDLKGGRPTVALKFDGSFLSTPQVVTFADGARYLLVSGGGGFQRLVTADGIVKWSYESGTDDALIPIVEEESKAVFFCSTGGSAVRLNLETGQKEWQFDFDGQIISGPVLINSKGDPSTILFFTDRGKAISVDASNGTMVKTVELGENVNEGYAIVPIDGKQCIVLGGKGNLSFIDPARLTVEKKVETGSLPIHYPSALVTDSSFAIAFTDFSRKINILLPDMKITTLNHLTDIDSIPKLVRGDDGCLRVLLIDVKHRMCLLKTGIPVPGTPVSQSRIISLN